MGTPHGNQAVDHSEEQIQDLMLVRRLFCAQMGQLARDREALLNKLLGVNCVDVNVLMYANVRLAQLTHLTTQLRHQAAAEYQMYLQFAAAFYRGVSMMLSGTPRLRLVIVCRPHHWI